MPFSRGVAKSSRHLEAKQACHTFTTAGCSKKTQFEAAALTTAGPLPDGNSNSCRWKVQGATIGGSFEITFRGRSDKGSAILTRAVSGPDVESRTLAGRGDPQLSRRQRNPELKRIKARFRMGAGFAGL